MILFSSVLLGFCVAVLTCYWVKMNFNLVPQNKLRILFVSTLILFTFGCDIILNLILNSI